MTALVALCLFFQQCAKIEGVSLDLDSNLLGVNSSDTFAVQSSTFLLDPLPTGNQGALLLGAYEQALVGKTTVSTYFRLAQPDVSAEFNNDVQFDSLTISLFYNGSSYGDTTQTLHLAVHRLTEAIDPKELSIALEDDEYPVFVSGETLYADQSFGYAEEVLGSVDILPKPNSTSDTVQIRLKQALGKELFDMIVKKDSKLTIEDEFLEYFKGLAIIPAGDAKAVIGFQDSVAFNLHYSYERQSDGRRISDEFSMSMASGSYQYNKVETDRSAGILSEIAYTNQELPSALTDNRTFIQGLSGLVTRIRFPNIRQTLGLGETAINRAQLIIETDQSELGGTPPPASLVLLLANKYGTPTSLVSNKAGTSLSAAYQTGSNSGGIGRGKYVFDITDYLSELIKTQTYNEEESLLLSLPTSQLLSGANMLQIAQGENKPAIKLNVLYIKTQ